MTRRDEIADLEIAPALWPAPGRPPLLLVATEPEIERDVALEPLERPLPAGVRPTRGDRWLDYGAGYGAFSFFAARLGAELVLPIEPERERAELMRRAAFLEEARTLRDPLAVTLSARELAKIILEEEINAVRLAGAPWLELERVPSVRKVVERTTRSRSRGVVERLEGHFSHVSEPAVGIGAAWAVCYVYAWGRRGAR